MAIEEKELYLRGGLRPKIEPCLNMLEYYYCFFHRSKGAQEPKAQMARSYPCFISMKHLLVHRRVTSQQYVAHIHFNIHLGEERQSGVKFLV